MNMSTISISGLFGNQQRQQPKWNFTKDTLFGRDKEFQEIKEQIQNINERTSSSSSLLIVLHGNAGCGKSSIVNCFPWDQYSISLACGKFDKQRSSQPYSAIIDAIHDSVQQWSANVAAAHKATISSRSSNRQDYQQQDINMTMMEDLKELLEKDRIFLQNVLPKAFEMFSSIVTDNDKEVEKGEGNTTTSRTTMKRGQLNNGHSTATKRLDRSLKKSSSKDILNGGVISSNNESAVHAAIRRILTFLCKSRNVVLFLDDIHWSDQSSLNVLKPILCGYKPIEGLIVIIAYRDEDVVTTTNNNEEDDDDFLHPVAKCLRDIESTEGNDGGDCITTTTQIRYIPVRCLDCDDVNMIVSSMLTGNLPEETLELSKVVHTKTAGNPFFVGQFLQFLRNECYVTYSFMECKWEWGDLNTIQLAANVTPNVADVVAATLHRLPAETLETLKVASLLGSMIPLDVLCEYFDNKVDDDFVDDRVSLSKVPQTAGGDIHNVLRSAVSSGILIRRSESSTKYMWSHEKLQTAAYKLIPESIRPSLHRRLALLLWNMSKEYPDAEWMIFMAADQLNRFYCDNDCNTSFGPEASRLNLEAAKLSLAKSALFPALEMLRIGAKNMKTCTRRWTGEFYDVCLELYSLLGEVAVLLGQHNDAMKAVREIDANAKTIEDKFRSQCVMLDSLTSGHSRDYALGVNKAIEVLKLYGEKLPNKLLPGQLYVENKKLKSKLGGSLDRLLDLPEMVDPKAMKITRLLVRQVATYGFQSPNPGHRHVGTFASIRALNMSLKRGITQDLSMVMLLFGINLKMDGYYVEAVDYAKSAIGVVDMYPQELGSLHGSVRAIAYCSFFPLCNPYSNALDGMLNAYRIGLRTGETEKAFVSVTGYSWAYLCIGLPLEPLELDLISYGEEAAQLGVPASVHILFKILRQAVINLRQTECPDPTHLQGVAMDQTKELTKLEGNASRMTLRDLNSIRLMLACIYNDWATAEAMVEFLESYLSFDMLLPRSHLRLLYIGLASLHLSRKTGKKKYRKMAKKLIKTFKEEIKKGSINEHPMLVMLEAEESPSKERYENAIKICARLGLVHHEAYLCERAAEYFLGQRNGGGSEDLAKYYLSQACSLYNDWGANGKVDAMKKDHGSLLKARDSSKAVASSVNSPLKGRSRYSARDSLQMSQIQWKSFSISSKIGPPGLEPLDGSSKSSVTSTSDDGKAYSNHS